MLARVPRPSIRVGHQSPARPVQTFVRLIGPWSSLARMGRWACSRGMTEKRAAAFSLSAMGDGRVPGSRSLPQARADPLRTVVVPPTRDGASRRPDARPAAARGFPNPPRGQSNPSHQKTLLPLLSNLALTVVLSLPPPPSSSPRLSRTRSSSFSRSFPSRSTCAMRRASTPSPSSAATANSAPSPSARRATASPPPTPLSSWRGASTPGRRGPTA